MKDIRLAIIATHPIQYYVPLYREIFSRPGVSGEVLFASRHGIEGDSFDPEFAEKFSWDVNLTDGFPHRYLNVFCKFGRSSANAIQWLTSVSSELSPDRYDIALIPGYRPLFEFQAIMSAVSGDLPIMLRPEGYDRAVQNGGIAPMMKERYLRWLYGKINVYLSIGNRSSRHFLAYGGSAERIVSAPYCVDNDVFRRGYTNGGAGREQLRRELKIPVDGFVIAFCGKMIDRKRPLVLAQAVARSRYKHKIFILWIGSGPLLNETKARCEADNLNTIFTGFVNQSQIGQYYSLADLHVLPSVEETWGLVVNETMNYGLPQIVTSGSGCGDDLINRRGTGFIVPIDDIDELRSKIDWMIENPKERLEMSVRSGEVINEFSIKVAADGVVAGAEMGTSPSDKKS